MAISKEQLMSIIGGRAKELCNPEYDNIKTSHKNTSNPSPSDYDYDADRYDSMFLSESMETPEKNNKGSYSQEMVERSRMPEFIKNSMVNERIDTSALQVNSSVSVLDGMNIVPQKQNKRKPVSEQSIPHYSQQSVDYSIIKAIVNECLNEYFSKQPLNESASLKTIGLKNGQISLVDNKGNVYKAKLEKVGNKNDIA